MKVKVWLPNSPNSTNLPVKQILPYRSSRALGWRVSAQVLQLLVYALQSHCEFREIGKLTLLEVNQANISLVVLY